MTLLSVDQLSVDQKAESLLMIMKQSFDDRAKSESRFRESLQINGSRNKLNLAWVFIEIIAFIISRLKKTFLR